MQREENKIIHIDLETEIDIIQAVTVVPMLAPIITEIACPKVSNPAFTKLTVITVVAVEDCTEAVTNVPVNSPVKRFVVIAPEYDANVRLSVLQGLTHGFHPIHQKCQ